jgi:carbamoyl-phosphate synthase large subunit
MNTLNICLLGAAKRNEFIRRLKTTALELGFDLAISSVEIDRDKFYPISGEVEIIEGPKFTDLIEFNLFAKNSLSKYDLIIPLMDSACLALAFAVESGNLSQKQSLVSNFSFVDLCVDKQKFANTLSLEFLPRIPNSPNKFPKIAKPNRGYGSKGLIHIPNEEKLNSLEQAGLLIQDFIDGPEVTLDAFFDYEGVFIQGIARDRLEIIDGEVNHLVTRDLSKLELSMLVELGSLGCKGPINLQTKGFNDSVCVLEINPRFGGGCTASMEAGMDLIKMSIDSWILSKSVTPYEVSHVEMVRSRKDYFRKVSN